MGGMLKFPAVRTQKSFFGQNPWSNSLPLAKHGGMIHSKIRRIKRFGERNGKCRLKQQCRSRYNKRPLYSFRAKEVENPDCGSHDSRQLYQ